MRELPQDVFEVRLHRDNYRDGTTIEVLSRMYDIRLAYRLRAMWGDPRRLADFVESFIGGTVRSWYTNRIGSASGREMAQALMPHWEREIHHHMERMEYEDRHRDRYLRPDQFIEYTPRHRDPYLYGWDMAWEPREDPKAKEKARQLLMRNLDDGQLKSFKKDGTFRVTAKDGKTYTISTARSFNVKAEDGTRYCGQLADTPIEDQMLAQKLLLQSEPEKFFKNANVSGAPSAMTATEIQMRYQEMSNMILRPGAILPWDSSV